MFSDSAAPRLADVAPCRVGSTPFAGWSTERPSLTTELQGEDQRQAKPKSTLITSKVVGVTGGASQTRLFEGWRKNHVRTNCFSFITYLFPL